MAVKRFPEDRAANRAAVQVLAYVLSERSLPHMQARARRAFASVACRAAQALHSDDQKTSRWASLALQRMGE